MRKDFTLPTGPVTRARVFAAVPGYGHVLLNGQRLSEDSAGVRTMSQFDRSVQVTAFNVTALLRQGARNALGLHLGRGAYGRYGYGPPAARLLLRATIGGKLFELGTDGSWSQHPSP